MLVATVLTHSIKGMKSIWLHAMHILLLLATEYLLFFVTFFVVLVKYVWFLFYFLIENQIRDSFTQWVKLKARQKKRNKNEKWKPTIGHAKSSPIYALKRLDYTQNQITLNKEKSHFYWSKETKQKKKNKIKNLFFPSSFSIMILMAKKLHIWIKY